MTVSMALIVRNEERTLARCLDSIRAAVDEIVVVDTGSEDNTKEVALRYTDRVFDFAWVHDFSRARQFAFDHARGDWVGWLDADDVVLGADAVPHLVKAMSADVGEIYWPYVVARDAYGNPTCRFWRERLVRNDGSYRWSGRVHEVLAGRNGREAEYCPDVTVEHRPPAREKSHTDRNLAILQAEYREQQPNPPSRLLFYLAREYVAAGRPAEALDMFAEHLACCTWDEERYQALMQVADLHMAQQEVEAAIDTLLQALKVCPHWPDAYFTLAKAYYQGEDWHKVVHWIEMGRAMPQPETRLFTNPMDYSFNWIIFYTNALYHLDEFQEALDWTRRALQICPGDLWHRQNLACFRQAVAGR